MREIIKEIPEDFICLDTIAMSMNFYQFLLCYARHADNDSPTLSIAALHCTLLFVLVVFVVVLFVFVDLFSRLNCTYV